MIAHHRDLLASFRTYFAVKPAVTDADREAVYRIRYRVYCEEFEYEQKESFPGGLEKDEFDETASHILVTHLATGMPAGCMRICSASDEGGLHGLPLDKCCAQSVDMERVKEFGAPPHQTCESSRFAVDGAFRRRSGEGMSRFGEIASLALTDQETRTFPLLSLVLMLGGVATANLLRRPYVYGVMEPFMPRLLKRSGLHFLRMGRDINHHGTRAVYITDTRFFLFQMEGEMETLYRWIEKQLAVGAGARSSGGASAKPAA